MMRTEMKSWHVGSYFFLPGPGVEMVYRIKQA